MFDRGVEEMEHMETQQITCKMWSKMMTSHAPEIKTNWQLFPLVWSDSKELY